jgi:hypothetical protein
MNKQCTECTEGEKMRTICKKNPLTIEEVKEGFELLNDLANNTYHISLSREFVFDNISKYSLLEEEALSSLKKSNLGDANLSEQEKNLIIKLFLVTIDLTHETAFEGYSKYKAFYEKLTKKCADCENCEHNDQRDHEMPLH